MSKSIALSLLAQGNTGDEILSILDVIESTVIEENIDSVAEVFAAVWCSLLCAPWLTLRGTYVTIGSVVIWQLIAAVCL